MMIIDRLTGFLVSVCVMSCIMLSMPSTAHGQFSTNSSLNISQDTPEAKGPALSKQEEREILGFSGDTSSRKIPDFPEELPQAKPESVENISSDSGYVPPLGSESLSEAASKENSSIGGKSSKDKGNPIATGSEYKGSDRTQYIVNTESKQNQVTSFSIGRTLISLLCVLLLIGGAAWFVRKLFPQQLNLSMGDVVQVVGRSPIDNRHTLSLVKFGDELLLLGITADNISLLDKVKDPDQIARLTGRIEAARVSSISKSFAGVFGKIREDYSMGTDLEDEVIVEEFDDESVSDVDRELDGLLKKVKGLGKINRRR